MVYLREIIEKNKSNLIQYKNIELVAYLSIVSPEGLGNHDFDLTHDEEVALRGYKRENVNTDVVTPIISRQPIKGISASSNIYKLSGLYLLSKDKVSKLYDDKFENSDLKQKYFISKIEPNYYSILAKEAENIDCDSVAIIINYLNGKPITSDILNHALQDILQSEIDVQTQILLEDLEKSLLKVKYLELNSEDLIRSIFNNFSNSIQKLRNRRKGHADFEINDEYDVQDLLYVILKSVFPNLRDEDPIAKQGAKGTRIDLIIREEEILIEVKMMKKSDSNETNFIEQLKIDIESYHQCVWLKKLFCFVYDPYKKTKDISNFNDLNGTRDKNGHKFEVEVIVVN